MFDLEQLLAEDQHLLPQGDITQYEFLDVTLPELLIYDGEGVPVISV